MKLSEILDLSLIIMIIFLYFPRKISKDKFDFILMMNNVEQ
jgi:hypothetical protein